MNKLKTMVRYECATSFKYGAWFYAIQYAITTFVGVLAAAMGENELGSKGLEANSLIFLAIFGTFSFRSDFRILLQNGFTRKYVFVAGVSSFAIITGLMSLVDTVLGNTFHYFWPNYRSVYSNFFGYGNIFINWLFMALFYMLVCMLFYFGILVWNRIGKEKMLFLTLELVGAVLVLIALFKYVLSAQVVGRIFTFISRAFGVMSDGTINHMYPILTLFVLISVLSAAAYAVVRRTELQ